MTKLAAYEVTLRRANRTLVNKVSLELQPGELVGLVGPNGAGKSTLLSMLAGLEPCQQGYIELGGIRLSSLSLRERSRRLAWVEQSGPINWPLSVERIVALGRRPLLGTWQQLGIDDVEAIEQALVATSCVAIRQQDATTLSGGERTRMLLARALAAEPSVLLADEPIAALDLRHQLQTMNLLRGFAVDSRSCLVVLHDLSLASRYCDRVYLMNQSEIVAQGLPREVLNRENLQSVYGVSVAIGEGEIPWIVPMQELPS